MKARIRYENTDTREGYAVEIMTDEGWGLDCFYPLVRRENASEDEERNFVHFSIFNKIRELRAFGYMVEFK